MTHFTIRSLLVLAILGGLGTVETSVATTTTTTTTSTSITSSTAFATTSSSMIQEYENDRVFGIFPSQPIASLTVHVRADPDYGEDDADCVFYGPGSPVIGFHGERTFTFASLSKGELDRSQIAFNCSYYTHEPHGPLDWHDIYATKVVAKNSEGVVVPTEICQTDSDYDEIPLPGPGDCREACGDAICDGGEPTVADALAVLRGALGSYACRHRVCDTNHDGAVTSADALKVLRRAVSLRSVLLCPPVGCEQ